MSVGFTDSIDGNIELLRELIGSLPPSKRDVCRRAAAKIENAVNAIKNDHGNDPAVGLGMAFAVCLVAKQLLESDNEGDKEGLIQLLS
jgi:hypothetical protein